MQIDKDKKGKRKDKKKSKKSVPDTDKLCSLCAARTSFQCLSTELEKAAKPMHSLPSIVCHHLCQKMILIFLKKVILEHYLQAKSKAAI